MEKTILVCKDFNFIKGTVKEKCSNLLYIRNYDLFVSYKVQKKVERREIPSITEIYTCNLSRTKFDYKCLCTQNNNAIWLLVATYCLNLFSRETHKESFLVFTNIHLQGT